jgi:simple sugar transport system permease protein
MTTTLPRWADLALIPALNLLLSFLVAGLVVVFIGENPLQALRILLYGSLGSSYGIGFTLYYAPTFVFTGLAVAIAFHAGLFNIGGEGQAALGGIGVTLVCLALPWPHWTLALPVAILGAGLFGAAWAFIPGYLQARRGSHIVITTIMFNFIASALVVYLLVNVLKAPGMAPETRNFAEGTNLPFMHEMLAAIGIPMARTPMNLSSILALVAAFLTWMLIWHTRLGYEMRAFGHSEPAAVYAGIDPVRITVIAMLLSGAMSGMMALNVVIGIWCMNVTIASSGAPLTGTIKPADGTIELGFRVNVEIDGVTGFPGLSANCRVGPIAGTLNATNYDKATGTATLTVADMAVPAVSGCGSSGLLNYDTLINDSLSLPGQADVTFLTTSLDAAGNPVG